MEQRERQSWNPWLEALPASAKVLLATEAAQREHGRSMTVAIHADYRARSIARKASGGGCLVPLRMEINNTRPESISWKNILEV